MGDAVAKNKEVAFNFEEDLIFYIPYELILFVNGKVELECSWDSGLIAYFRELGNQDAGIVMQKCNIQAKGILVYAYCVKKVLGKM